MATKEKKTNIVFTPAMDDELINLLHEQILLGRRGDRGFKTEAYVSIAKSMTESTNNHYEFTEVQIRNRVKKLKQNFQIASELLNASGFGFDSATKRLTASPEVWEEWLKGNPTHKSWRRKTMDHPKLSLVFGGDTTTVRYSLPLNNEDKSFDNGSSTPSQKTTPSQKNMQLDNNLLEGVAAEPSRGESSSCTSKTRKRKTRMLGDLMETMRESAISLGNAIKDAASMIADPGRKLAEDVYRELKKLPDLSPEDVDICHEWMITNLNKARLFLTTDDKCGWLSRRLNMIRNWDPTD